ncbi:MAG: S9 family peptidase [Gemmatimonadaceae bacterium]|nr:S9 family peptidase [Gemmatimonadaceae bacterium]
MRTQTSIAAALLSLSLLTPPEVSAQKRPMTFDDLAAVRGVSDPQVSPSGTLVLYAARTADVPANRRSTATFLVSSAGGGAAKQFPSANVKASEARWSPDGRQVTYITGGQLWLADADGTGARQLTKLSGGASGPVWSPKSDRIAFVSSVYPDCADDACNASRSQAEEANPVKAHIADNLMYRHWTAWAGDTRSHLFVVGTASGAPVDVTRGVKYDVPPGPFGGSEGYAFSPDGEELAYTAKDQGREDAWSTDINVYTVSAGGGTPAVITLANKGADVNPVYSPDGRSIIYQSQARAGFESDRGRLMAYDRASRTSKELLPSWDATADAYGFTAAGDAIYISTADASRNKIYRITRTGTGWTSRPELVVGTMNNSSLSLSRDGRTMAWVRDAVDHPAEIYVSATSGRGAPVIRQLTHENDALIAQLALHPAEFFWFKGANGDSVQGMLVRPAQWQPGRKYPVLFLIHGGPQGAWFDQWHGRWNFSLFASRGMAVVAINPRGSTGYGQKFVDDISRDWGGKVYTDLMNGLDAALARNNWLDSTRMGAAGGSYGGYMTNWIEGHSTRFKALFTHAGPFNLENMYAATEELWFPEWEYGGPSWDKTAMDTQYRVWSPHLYAANFRTPMLIVHGELDYRVSYYEGVSMFTALQRQGVPSRLIVFPDEGHWIGKPLNQKLWWGEVLGWFEKYLRPGA